jgi:uncharacterized protein YjiS (DUF1127 family)
MSTTCCTPAVVATHRPLALPGWHAFIERLQRFNQARREQARLRAEWRSLQGLSDSTLRDIGLAERIPEPRYTLGMLDHERGRWS